MIRYLNPVTGDMNPLDLENPEPGIYEGVSHRDYLHIRAVSRSSLYSFAKSPEDYLYPNYETTEPMIVGTQYHAYLLRS